jgi:hypothetical protein
VTKDQFQTWFRDFRNIHKGVCTPDNFFDLVETKHKDIREKIGGIDKTIKVKIENESRPAPASEYVNLYIQLYDIIPEFWETGEVTLDALAYPTAQGGKRPGVKWGKKIEYFRRKNKVEVDKARLDATLGRLGEIWAKYKSEEQDICVTLSTNPCAFTLLGHYRTDINPKTGTQSCFKQMGQRQLDKYCIAAYKDSYVLLVTKNPLSDDWNKNTDVEARAWGMAYPDLTTFHLSNMYLKINKNKDGISIGNVMHGIEVLFSNILENKVIKTDGILKVGGGIYKNPEPSLTYSLKPVSTSPYANIVEPLYPDIRALKPCLKCLDYPDNMIDIDGYKVCEGCLPQVPRCDWTNELTLSHMCSAYHPDTKKVIRIKEMVAENGEWKRCAITGYYIHKLRDQIVTAERYGQTSVSIAEKHGLKKCMNCSVYTNPGIYGANRTICTGCIYKEEDAKKHIFETNVFTKPIKKKKMSVLDGFYDDDNE